MRRTEILRQVTIILIAVVCLAVAGIMSYEIYKSEKPTENVEKVSYMGHTYLYFKNIKCLIHDDDCTWCKKKCNGDIKHPTGFGSGNNQNNGNPSGFEIGDPNYNSDVNMDDLRGNVESPVNGIKGNRK